jgi:hypothetical protein
MRPMQFPRRFPWVTPGARAADLGKGAGGAAKDVGVCSGKGAAKIGAPIWWAEISA